MSTKTAYVVCYQQNVLQQVMLKRLGFMRAEKIPSSWEEDVAILVRCLGVHTTRVNEVGIEANVLPV